MQDEPSATTLLAAVIAFLREAAIPALPHREAFEARVAANALELVKRDLAVGRKGEYQELCRLAQLLGHSGTLAELNSELALALRESRLDPASADVSDHLWRTTFEKLSVDQPSYAAYGRALDEHCRAGCGKSA